MFYAHFVLSKKGPLARIWLAAHWDKKLTKAHVFETNIEGSVEAIIQPKMKLALRTSGHLLLGVVRIYSRKAKYLLADCNEAFVKIKMAFRPGAVDLPEENREAAMAAITLPEDFHEFDTTMADLSDIDVHAQFAVNQSRPEEITMREELGNITLVGDDGFGDMGFDGSAGVIQDANLDDSLYKNADAAFLLGDDGVTSNDQHTMGFDDAPGGHEDGFASGSDNYDGPGDDDDDNESVGGHFSGDVGTDLFGENFTGETGGLFEEPPSLAPPVVDNVALMPLDTGLPAEQPDSIMMSPGRQSRFALNDITLQQNVTAPLLNNTFDQSALFNDEAEAFALEPIDINTVGTERKVRKKRKLVIDEQKAISSETMKIQLSDTSEIVTTLDLAPPTKKLMHWKETGGVEKLFAFSGRQMISKRLAKLFTNNLITRSATAENGDTTIDSVSHTVEQGRFVNDSVDHTDSHHSRHSPVRRTPGRTQLMSPPRAPLPDVGSPAPAPTPVMNTSNDDYNPMPSYGGGDSDDDNYGGFEQNDDDDDDDVRSEPEQEQDDVTTLEPVDDEPVEEGKEAEAEERRWNKRSQQMLVALNRSLQRHDNVSFRQMAPPSTAHSRKQAAAKFYTFLVLKKMEAIQLSQDGPYGDILISRGPKFELLG